MSQAQPDTPRVKIIPPLIYLAGLVIGLLVSILLPTPLLPVTFARSSGGVLLVLGIALLAWSIFNFKRHRTTIRPDRAASALITTGPYTLTRNPIYVGFAAVYLGVAIAAQSLWALILLPVVLLIIQRGAIEKEEAFLERRFGPDYTHYKARVRRWL